MASVEIGRDEENKPIIIEYDEILSFKSFVNQDLKDRQDLLPGKIIYKSQFYWETPGSDPFPSNMTGIKFVDCNLDNLFIPAGNEIVGAPPKNFEIQTDQEDWVIDESFEPLEPVNKKLYENLGLSTDPNDLPDEPLSESIIVLTLEGAQ